MEPDIKEQLGRISRHLHEKRADIMRAWRRASEQDPEQTTSTVLTRAQFYDHIPNVLDALEAQLLAPEGSALERATKEYQKMMEACHGLHRWQQGYRLREVTREWGLLHRTIFSEVESFAINQSGLSLKAFARANRVILELVNEAINDSTSQYMHMEKQMAAGRIQDLEHALQNLTDLDRQRGELLRQTVHDLGGNVQAMGYAASMLSFTEADEQDRTELANTIRRSVSSLRDMLRDLMSLARLEAGIEKRNITEFDAAKTLKEMCQLLSSFAVERGLALHCDGPTPCTVSGDFDKVRRIVQNLVVNALKYTKEGSVSVLWGLNDSDVWWITVADTGPGIPGAHPSGLFETVQQSPAVDCEMDSIEEESVFKMIDPVAAQTREKHHGEGIGLSIVKRLCDLLHATLEVSSTEKGTTFRISLPTQY